MLPLLIFAPIIVHSAKILSSEAEAHKHAHIYMYAHTQIGILAIWQSYPHPFQKIKRNLFATSFLPTVIGFAKSFKE